jgi:spore maturation protein SpmA/spore maturation protein SpmB
MALSRVWSYIILLSIAVACYQYFKGDTNIFNDIVTEKKLKADEEFSKISYCALSDFKEENKKRLTALSKKLKVSNWNEDANIFNANYLLTENENIAQARAQLQEKINNAPIFSYSVLSELKSGTKYFPVNYAEPEKLLNDSVLTSKQITQANYFLQSDVIVTNVTNTDSLRKNFLAKLNRQKIIPVSKVAYYLPKNIDGIFETGKFAITLVVGLIGTLALFMGLLNIAERAGGINLLSRFITPFLSKLFPSIPKGHASFGHMVMNFSANILGLDNAATPFGLKAMQSLQELNPEKEKATDAQLTFLALHAAGLTLIPVSIIAVRAANGSQNPNEIFIPLMLATFVCTLVALLLVSFKQGINVLQPKLFFPLFGIASILAFFIWFLRKLQPYALEQFSDSFSNGAILVVFLVIIAGGLYKKIDLFDAFVDGAKGGFETAVRIIPYMVGMLVAVSMLRTSGAFDLIITPIKTLVNFIGIDNRFVETLPVALLRPFSAGGARGFMVDAMNMYGADSFIGKMAAVLQGSSETTFYVVALYFGSVSVKNTRYAIPVMLLADLAGVIFSILICYALWG